MPRKTRQSAPRPAGYLIDPSFLHIMRRFPVSDPSTADYVRAHGGTPCAYCSAFAGPEGLCHSCQVDALAAWTEVPA